MTVTQHSGFVVELIVEVSNSIYANGLSTVQSLIKAKRKRLQSVVVLEHER
jgi:hypothetical protein